MRSFSRLYLRRQGMALVAILALIVILSVILVAFVSQSRVEVTASNSFSSAVSADSLARDAVNNIISSLLYEIEAGSSVSRTNGFAIYTPSTAQDILPKFDARVPVGVTTNLPNLIRTSGTGALFEGSTANSVASPITTDQASVDGKRLSLQRWNYPQLLTSSQNASLTPPAWIYVERQGPVALTSWSSILTQPLVGDALNRQYVIGRYAYRIYDISGLIDVNVAGYPGLNTPTTERIGRKGGLAWADLAGTSFAGWVSSPALSGDLMNWRWPGTGYSDYVDEDGVRSGFLQMPAGVPGINRFLNRADLLGFLKGNSASQFPNNGEDFAPQVTVFSRELNAPSWRPDDDASTSAKAMNPSVLSVRVLQEFTRRDGTTAAVGAPLLNSRFPLSKINLFGDPSANESDIRKYFGLERNSDGTWRYIHGRVSDNSFNFSGDADGSRERLKTLQEVAAGTPGDPSLSAEGASDSSPREPNFFELLQAGILLESLGQGRTNQNHSLQNTWADRNIARHVLQVGANIIDQWDADDNPTVIARTPFALLANSTGAIDSPDPDISGIENLPYIYKVPWTFFRRFDRDVSTGTDGQPVWPWVSAFYQFQLWNPHRNAASFSTARNMRIVATGSPVLSVSGRNEGGAIAVTDREAPLWPEGETWIGFGVYPGGRDFSSPHTLKSDDSSVATAADDSSQSRSQYVYAPPGYQASILGFYAGSMCLPYTRRTPPSSGSDGKSHRELYDYREPTESVAARATIQQTAGTATSFQLQKQDSDGHWLPVQTVPCIGKATHSFHVRYLMPSFGDDSQKLHNNRVYFRSAYMTADPRTWRFGYPQMGNGDGISEDALLSGSPIESAVFSSWLASNAGGTQWINDGLALNQGGTSFYGDRGGSGPRVGDTADTGANPFSTISERPTMLNRPFKSVAEMAYAHRGLPWKSLNFTKDLASSGGKNTADSALLDLFTIEEEPLVRAGVINLNTASPEAITALLLQSEILAGNATAISNTEAKSAAEAIYQYLHGTSGGRAVADPAHVLQTRADIARMIQTLGANQFSGWSKRKKDSLVAALAQVHSARTWNLLVDVVAQSGKFPPGTSGSLDRFVVAGERRWLVHLAIDRLTGEVVEQLTEQVTE